MKYSWVLWRAFYYLIRKVWAPRTIEAIIREKSRTSMPACLAFPAVREITDPTDRTKVLWYNVFFRDVRSVSRRGTLVCDLMICTETGELVGVRIDPSNYRNLTDES